MIHDCLIQNIKTKAIHLVSEDIAKTKCANGKNKIIGRCTNMVTSQDFQERYTLGSMIPVSGIAINRKTTLTFELFNHV